MRNVIKTLRLKFQNLSDDDVVRLTQTAELQGGEDKATDKWQTILAALRPRLHKIRPPRILSLSRQFFQPIEDMLVNEREGEKRLGQIDRSSLKPIWKWLQNSSASQAIKTAESFTAKMGPTKKPQDVEVLLLPVREAARKSMLQALDESEHDLTKKRTLAASLGGLDALKDFREIALSLSVSAQLLQLQKALPENFDAITDQRIDVARESFNAIDYVNPNACYFVPMVFFNRLSQPWEVLRLTAAVSRLSTDELLMIADFRIVCDRLLDLLRREQRDFERTADDDVAKLIGHLKWFVDIYSGISKITPIKKQSDLGICLQECGNRFADQVAKRVKSLSRFIQNAIPESYGTIERRQTQQSENAPAPHLSELAEKVALMADFIAEVSRLSYLTNLYFGIDQEIKNLNTVLDKRLLALTLAYRRRPPIPVDTLDQYYDVLAPAFRKLLGSEASGRLKKVKA